MTEWFRIGTRTIYHTRIIYNQIYDLWKVNGEVQTVGRKGWDERRDSSSGESRYNNPEDTGDQGDSSRFPLGLLPLSPSFFSFQSYKGVFFGGPDRYRELVHNDKEGSTRDVRKESKVRDHWRVGRGVRKSWSHYCREKTIGSPNILTETIKGI